ncbi:DUF4184 family protein [Solicola sp. PLA-1-18]|uniref:DUF4184 family protein n=1 Tax=Solicola sp. PLA-1-18 TaxID=3380532 RepID=UPI003B763D35
MPFTLVHPAAVLPLARSPLVPSALVAGAVAPDLPYYVPLQWIGGDWNLTLTHDVTSLLWLDPLIALVLLVAFHAVLKQPLVALAPPAVARRVLRAADGFAWRGPVAAGWIVVSTVLGAATHLAWDALDDAFGYGWSTRLNLVSDAVGGVALLGWLWLWWRTTAQHPVPPGRSLPAGRRARVLVGVALAATAWTALRAVRTASEVGADLRAYGGYSRSAVTEYVVRGAAVDAVTAVVVLLGLFAIGWRLGRARNVVETPR